MRYIHEQTQTYPLTVGDIKARHPDVSFGLMTSEILRDFGYAEVNPSPAPQWNEHLQKLVELAPTKIEESWFVVWSVVDMTPTEQAEHESKQAELVRQARNEKLAASDWTQVADAPVDKAAWAAYRQALRDVPTQAGFPWDVIWPEQP